MFPKHPILICRSEKCLNEIIANDIDVENFRNTKEFACHECGRSSRQRFNKMDRFFKCYPRLVTACDNIKMSGFAFSGYKVAKSGINHFYIDEVCLSCMKCNRVVDIPAGMFNDVIADPDMIACRHCKTAASRKMRIMEFFIDLKNVHNSIVYNLDFQWDIFRPIHMNPMLMRPRYFFYCGGR